MMPSISSAFLPALALAAVLVAPLGAQLPISSDGFESGNTLAWDERVGESLIPADAYRYTQLALRDPHVFLDLPVFGCFDFTDNDLPLGLGPSLNNQVATLLSSDGDGDGLLDLSPILLFRPYDASAVSLRVDQGNAACTAPVATTSCDLDGLTVPQTTGYDGLAAGSCLAPEHGTTSGYAPAPPEPAGPCFVTAPRDAVLLFLGTEISLSAGQVAAESLGPAPPTGFQSGLSRGFLSEADADLILLPPELPLVGGQPLSTLLPGGTGSCAPGDDRDQYLGQSGWWFYFELSATAVPYTGP